MRAELGSAYCSVGEVSKSGGWCLTGQWPGKFHAPMSDSAASAVASLVSGSAVLDLGCGTGAFGHWLSTRGRQYAVTYMGYDGAENVEQYTRQARHQPDKTSRLWFPRCRWLTGCLALKWESTSHLSFLHLT